MKIRLSLQSLPWLLVPIVFLAGCLVGRQAAGPEKTLMHVFLYSPLPGATQADFDNFKKATSDLVGAVPGIRRVWVGKLREPTPAENDTVRTYGVAMEFDDMQALGAYAAHPAHRQWEQVYERVRVRGTTTFDLLPE
jgi:hypothetical protein